MSIIAPVARHIGLEPLSHHHSRCRRRSSELVAAHVLAAAHAVVPRRSSVVDPQTSVVSAQLSLKGLLQSDNVQTIQENLVILARFAGHLPRDVEATRSSVTNDELLIMGKLVRDISASLERIGSLREDDEEVLPDVADKYVPMRPISSVTRRRRKEKMQMKTAHKCHNCSRLETPKWRPGPDGPRTLCNVCGLIYTKRQQRHAEQMMRAARDE